MKKRKILITDASCLSAEAIISILREEENYEIFLLNDKDIYSDEKELSCLEIDPVDKQEVKKFCLDLRPDVIINTHEMSDYLECEKKKRECWESNVYVVENLARISKVTDCHLIHLSTDEIFNGKSGPYDEDSLPEPLNYYAKSKHAGDNACIAGCNYFSILRISELFGPSEHGFYSKLNEAIDAMGNGDVISLSNGHYRTPSFTDDLGLAVQKIISRNIYGIINVAGPDLLSYFEMGFMISDIMNFSLGYMKKINARDYDRKISHPRVCGLNNSKSETSLMMNFTNFENALQIYRQRII